MPSKTYQKQHPLPSIQNLSSHFLASDGWRVLRGRRPKSPRGAKCLVAGCVPPRLSGERRTVVQRRLPSDLHGRVGGL